MKDRNWNAWQQQWKQKELILVRGPLVYCPLTNDPHGFLKQNNEAGEQQSTLWRFGCRGFAAASTIRLLKDLGIHGQAQVQIIIEPSGLWSTAANRWGSGGQTPTGPQDAEGSHPGLISLWWARLSRGKPVRKRLKTPNEAKAHNWCCVPNISWWLLTNHQTSVEDLQTYKDYSLWSRMWRSRVWPCSFSLT